MTERSRNILARYQMRKTRKQKTAFLEFMKREFPQAAVEEGGLFRSRNLVIGDLNSAKVVFAAHYDTCAALPFPNWLTPKNVLGTLLYALLICIPLFAISFVLSTAAMFLTGNFWVAYCADLLVLAAFLFLMLGGRPNRNTVNDNTSGVIMLCELLERLDEEERAKAAFVFFDNEEYGMLGSAQFRKQHKAEMKQKLLINFDCISDGDHILLILSKKAHPVYADRLWEAFLAVQEKCVQVERSSAVFYPSDQMQFPVHAGVAAFRRSRFWGLYLGRIHTKRDTVMDESNIECLFEGMRRFLQSLNETN